MGITALIPPELIFACEMQPCDVNNFVTQSNIQPSSKLCAWTAIWRELILKSEIPLEYLVVVAGGDCHNAIVDGEKIEMEGKKTLYFFYPFEEDSDYLKNQLERLSDFLGGIKNPDMFKKVNRLKQRVREVDDLRIRGKIPAESAFKIMVSTSDLQGDIETFETTLNNIQKEDLDCTSRVALLGVPPINYDFHKTLDSMGFHVVFDELPYEFCRLSGNNIDELAKNYCNYTFSRNIEFRLDFLKKELKRRKVEGIIHYTQFACHHLLEDEILRKYLDYPYLTIQGDLPGRTSPSAKVRLEAFSEMLAEL